jgi:hypothetical protein
LAILIRMIPATVLTKDNIGPILVASRAFDPQTGKTDAEGGPTGLAEAREGGPVVS